MIRHKKEPLLAMASLRVKPSDFARDRATARENAKALKNAQIEAELSGASFKPEIFTKTRRPSMDAPPRSTEELVKEQMKNANPEERPLPTTLQKMNLTETEMPAEIDSLNAAMRAERAPKSPKKQSKKPSNLSAASSENKENSVAVYFPRDSVESLNLKDKVKRGPTQAESDAGFKMSLRAETDNYNIDALAVPVGQHVKTASLRAKGGLAPRRDPAELAAAAAAAGGVAGSSTVKVTPTTPKSGDRGVSGIPRSGSGSGKRRGRPGSASRAHEHTTSIPLPGSFGSGEKSKARSRLSLLKSKMPKRMSESAKGPSRPPMASISPKGGTKERRRASLTAAVTKFQDKLASNLTNATAEEAHMSHDALGMSMSASESQLQFNESINSAASQQGTQVKVKERGGSKGVKGVPDVAVKKAAKVDRPTFRPRREADYDGFDPVTGEPLSPTIHPRSTKFVDNNAVSGDDINTNNTKENSQDYSNVYRSVEIHHKASAEVTVPDIFIDLPADAFAQSSDANNLVGCPHCDRRFSEIALKRHVNICKTVFLEKPKVFNSSRMRISGIADVNRPDNTEMKILESAVTVTDSTGSTSLNSPTAARLLRKQKKAEEKRASKKKAPEEEGKVSKEGKWKAQSNALRKAMLEARGKSTAHLGSTEGGDFDSGNSLVPCPHCNRKFNQKAADRHIPQCQSIKARPATLKKGSGKMAVASSKPTSTFKKIMTRFM